MAVFIAEKVVHEKADFAVRNAEARSSTLLCSTNNPAAFKYLQPQVYWRSFSLVTPL